MENHDMGEGFFTTVEEGIHSIFGNERRIIQKSAVSGGDINDAYSLVLDNKEMLFMKTTI